MRKTFTLIEMIVVIAVLGILAAVVIANVSDFRNNAIKTSMESNIGILQLAVDQYALDNKEYPIQHNEGSSVISLDEPKYIDIDKLYPKYIKSDAELKQVKEEYYWIDMFGKVWGSTKDTAKDVIRGENSIELSLPSGVRGYSIYEVTGYGLDATVEKKSYRKVHSRKITEDNPRIQIPDIKEGVNYLFSTIDKYGLESAPVGVNYQGSGSFPPILEGEGSYEFELASFDVMIWYDFKSVHETPGESRIDYSFAVKDEDGEYGEFTDDFYSLPKSKGIKVKVDLYSDGENKPSVHFMRVFYRYEDEEIKKHIFPKIEYDEPEEETEEEEESRTSYTERNGGWTSPVEEPEELRGNNNTNIEALTCGTGGSYTTVNYRGEVIEGESPKIVYNFKIPEGHSVSQISIPKLKRSYGYKMDYTSFEYSHEGAAYEPIDFVSDVPDNSCVKVIYHLEEIEKSEGTRIPPFFSSPTVELGKEKPEIIKNSPSRWNPNGMGEGKEETDTSRPEAPVLPNKGDRELEDPNWKTIDNLNYFAHSGDGQRTRWVSFTPDDVKPENTRIVYRFATSNGYHWSKQVDDFGKLPQSESLLIVAYLQVHKDFVEDVNQEKPTVNGIRIVHERGAIDLDSLRPTLAIYPIKDNNGNRADFSDESNIEWTYETFDPRGREIVEIEWDGDIREKYPVGEYEVKLRVKNESSFWSEWVTYVLEVKQEKPVAHFDIKEPFITIGKNINYVTESSYDPDNDALVEEEWKGKRTSFDKVGNYTISYRVKDEEGYWSDWYEKEVTVYDEIYKLSRIEAEDKRHTSWTSSGQARAEKVNYEGASNNEVVHLKGYQYSMGGSGSGDLIFTFEGNGLVIGYMEANGLSVYIDGKKVDTIDGDTQDTISIQGLVPGEHELKIVTGANNFNYGYLDYIEVYSPYNNPKVYDTNIQQVKPNGETEDFKSIITNLDYNVEVRYSVMTESNVSIFIKNQSGQVVKNIMSNKQLKGGSSIYKFTWDGTNNSGGYVETGDYTLHIVSENNKGKQHEFKDTIHVDNERPISRIEAEDERHISLATTNQAVANKTSYDGSSNNEVTYLRGYRHYMGSTGTATLTYTFEGTGIDVKYMDTKSLDVYINGVLIRELESETPELFSIRGLSLGEHTIKIQTKGNSSSYGYIDYFEVFSSENKPKVYDTSIQQVKPNGETEQFKTVIPNLGFIIEGKYSIMTYSKVNIFVKDQTGRTVKNIITNKQLKGGSYIYKFTWDGTNNSGGYVETGDYTLYIVTENDKGIKDEFKDTIHVDNKKPTARIEGEDTKHVELFVSRSGPRANKVSYEGASNNEVTYLRGYRHYMGGGGYATLTYTFEGTGLDMKYMETQQLDIYIDGILIRELNTESSDIFSIRDLLPGEHTVLIRTKNNSNSYGYIDYFDVYN